MSKQQQPGSELLIRLLHAVVLTRGLGRPTGGKILKLCKTCPGFTGNPSGLFFDDQTISKWLHEGVMPRSKFAEQILFCINWLLFDEDKSKYVKDLIQRFNSTALSSSIKSTVERALVDETIAKGIEIRNVLVAPDYENIDPAHLDVHITTGASGPLKAHLLYHSPVSPDIWDRVKAAPEYPLYRLCQDGLTEILHSPEWDSRSSDLRIVFNLGAGSASKDTLILRSLAQCKSKPTFAWVDASMYMLLKTIRGVNRYFIGGVNGVALAADFEHPARLRKVYEDSFPTLPEFKERKAFFVLGFTLSNLHEEQFFSSYKKVCEPGDLFIFPMQFIPEGDSKVRDKFKKTLLESYDFEEGRKLSQAWVALLQEYSLVNYEDPTIEDYRFNGSFRSLCVEFRAVLKDRQAIERTVVTARSIRHYRTEYLAYLYNLGFKVLCESSNHDGVVTLLIEYVGKAENASPTQITKDRK